MNPSAILKRFLNSGKQPASQREAAALLDESRGLLLSKLPTTGETISNFTTAELDSVNLKGGNVLDQMHKVYLEKQGFTPSSSPSTMKVFTKASHPIAKKSATPAPAGKPAAKQDRIADLCAIITQPRKPIAKTPTATAPKAITAAARPLADASNRYLIQAATHRSAPEAGKAAARAELVTRGFTISPDGKAVSRSQRGGRQAKLSK
jgi:hypothetical protein